MFEGAEPLPLDSPSGEEDAMVEGSETPLDAVGGGSEVGRLQARLAIVQVTLVASEREVAAAEASRADAQAQLLGEFQRCSLFILLEVLHIDEWISWSSLVSHPSLGGCLRGTSQ